MMWFVKLFRSKPKTPHTPRYYALGAVAVVAVLMPSLTTLGALVTTDRYIVRDVDTFTEDQYITSTTASIEGLVDADVVIFTGSLTISGEVTGSVTVLSFGSVNVTEQGSIRGSLNGTAGSLHIAGSIGDDVFIAAASIVVDSTGRVGRDLMAFGGALTVEGEIGRDVRGRMVRTTIAGTVGRDLDVATQGLHMSDSAVVGGDVLYRSPGEADISSAAQITGTVTRLPTQGNFIYSIILTLANVVGFLGFVVAGIVALWLLRASGSRAVGSILTNPVKTLLVGIVAVIVFPAIVVLLAVTLVGLPLAAVAVMIGVAAFVVGPVPAVTALGNRVLINRGGLFGAFVLGAAVWRFGIWLIPVVGGYVYLIALIWGVGGWILGIIAARSNDDTPIALLPRSIIVPEEVPPDWEPPLAP